MSLHPSDHAVAALVRNARLGAAATPQHPARTRSFGSHSARQCTVGRLVVEAARADTGVSKEVAAARREIIAAEFERRRLIEAAEQTRRQADLDLSRADGERDDAVRQARQQDGPTPDFLRSPSSPPPPSRSPTPIWSTSLTPRSPITPI